MINDEYQIQINDSDKWKKITVKQISHAQRFQLKYNIDGVYMNCSVVISPEQVAIFNEVCEK